MGNMQNYMTQNMYYGNNYIEPYRNERKNQTIGQSQSNMQSFVRYKRIDNKKYK